MRLAKMLGLALVSTAIAMAFLGSGAAMAKPTALCLEHTGNLLCQATKEPGTVHYAGSATLLFKTPMFNTNCESMLILGANLKLANPLTLHVGIGDIVFTNCNVCSVVQETAGTLLVLKEGTELASYKAHGLELFIQCGKLISCFFKLQGSTAHGLGPLLAPPNGDVVYQATNLPPNGGAFCPTKLELDATLQSLVPLYIRE